MEMREAMQEKVSQMIQKGLSPPHATIVCKVM